MVPPTMEARAALSGGKCPSGLQHCLGLFLSCPPFVVLLNPLGQPRALCFPAAEGVGRAFMPVQGEIWVVEVYGGLLAGSWGKEDGEGQLCAAFNCSACGARGFYGSWLPEFWVLCQKTFLPTLVKETGPFCWGCLWSLMACRKVLVQGQRRDMRVLHLKLYYLIQHVSQYKYRTNSAAVIKLM